MEALQSALAPFYLYIKAIHVISAALWSFSTAVAWVMYLKPALVAAGRSPEDAQAVRRRDEFMERFDTGASIEHVALVIMAVTGLAMIWIREVNLFHWSFIPFKFWIGVIVILPMEVVDIWLSHMGGNKHRLRKAGDRDRYDQVMGWHMLFLRVTEPLVVVLIPTMFIIAVAKPF